jgi:aspartate 1-decarboxylase
MQIRVCASKIHRAKVTGADLNYVGSITIDQALMEAANIKPYQMVIINNLSNAVSWQTYAISGEKGKGDVILNGPPARIFQKGDIVIILAEAYLEPAELKDFVPVVVFVDESNKPTKIERHKELFK